MPEAIDTDSIKSQVAQMIIERIESGEKLPTEKEMVKQLGVSRTVVREVLSVYEATGFITSLQGSGRYVQMPNFGEHLADTWSLLLWANPKMLLELLEIRGLLEINSLPQAMQRVNMEQLQQLHARVAAMKEKAAQGQPFAHDDREFHRILFSSTKNTLLEQLLTAFWDLYEAAKVEAVHEKLNELAVEHEEILNAFARQDIATMRKLMQEQFDDARYRIVVALMNNDVKSGKIVTANKKGGQ